MIKQTYVFNTKKVQIWGMYNWNLFQDPHRWRYCNRKNHLKHLDRSPADAKVGRSHLQRIPWTAAYSVYHSFLQIIIEHQNSMLLSPGCMQDAWAPPIAWHSVGSELISHTSTGTVMQQDDIISEFTQMFVLDPCKQLLKCVAVTVGINFVCYKI
jgi:hypothetical protein